MKPTVRKTSDNRLSSVEGVESGSSMQLTAPEQKSGTQDNPYQLILQELRRKRDEIEAAIAAIELVATSPGKAQAITLPPAIAGVDEVRQPISEALLAVMRDLGGAARNGEIRMALAKSGFRFRGNPTVSVAQCLVRLASAKLVTKLDRGVWKLLPAGERLSR